MFKFKQNLSKEIFFRKYDLYKEGSVEKVLDGVAEEIASPEKTEELRAFWKNEFYKALISGELMAGGRILANARPFSLMRNYNNCFTIDVEDSMESIYDALKEDALIGKVGGGVGFNISKLRPKGASISKGGESSGVMSFLEIFDTSAKAIHTGGSRRGAHICILNIDHPDIEEFIEYKEGGEHGKLTQFNISVGVTDEFMRRVLADEDWDLQFEGKVYKTVKAKELYDKMTKRAWWYNEPGALFLDTVENMNNAPHHFKVDRANPCITGDTIIAVADGRNGVSIKDLCKEEDFPVYSGRFTNRNKWVSEIKNAVAFKTGTKEIVEVKLSDGSSFKSTPSHKLALLDGGYIEAKDSLGKELSKFYSFSNKNSKKSYRIINSKSNGYARQYRLIWEYYNGKYGKGFNVDHLDFDSTNDNLSNLELITEEEHKKRTKEHWSEGNNPINSIEKNRLSILQRQKNVLSLAKRDGWSEAKVQTELNKIPPLPAKTDNNIVLDSKIYVVSVSPCGVEDVYNLTVEDNHNFYIITKTDDKKYLNSSGILIKNCGF